MKKKQNIKCNVKSCKHNCNDQECDLDEIKVKSNCDCPNDEVKDQEETNCSSFEEDKKEEN